MQTAIDDGDIFQFRAKAGWVAFVNMVVNSQLSAASFKPSEQIATQPAAHVTSIIPDVGYQVSLAYEAYAKFQFAHWIYSPNVPAVLISCSLRMHKAS